MYVFDMKEEEDWREPIRIFLEDPNRLILKKVRMKAAYFQLLDGVLYKKNKFELYLKCLNKSKAYLEMHEVHEETCGAHQAGRKMKNLEKTGFFCQQ